MDVTRPRPPEGPTRRSTDRLSPRYRVADLRLHWSPPTRSILGVRPRRVPAEVIDLSVSGALLLAPRNPKVRRGANVAIDHGGAHGLVKVRHTTDTTVPELQCYGVLFVALDPVLERLVFDRVGRSRGEDGDRRAQWDHAH
jgi:hypothetical protein